MDTDQIYLDAIARFNVLMSKGMDTEDAACCAAAETMYEITALDLLDTLKGN
jgi:hypothetical protein